MPLSFQNETGKFDLSKVNDNFGDILQFDLTGITPLRG